MMNNTNAAATALAGPNITHDVCPIKTSQLNTTPSTHLDGPFNWSPSTQGIILGAFFGGYMLTQVPGGWCVHHVCTVVLVIGMLAERYGGKWVLGVFMLCSAVFTLLSPLAASIDPILFMVVRALIGVSGVSRRVIAYTHLVYYRTGRRISGRSRALFAMGATDGEVDTHVARVCRQSDWYDDYVPIGCRVVRQFWLAIGVLCNRRSRCFMVRTMVRNRRRHSAVASAH
jgi:hypothetical protein